MLTEIVGAIRQLREVAAEVAPPAEPESPMALLPGIIDLVKTSMQNQQQAMPAVTMPAGLLENPAPVAMATAPAAAPADAAAAPMQEEEDMNLWLLKGALARLVRMAQAGRPASEGADLVLQFLPDHMLEIVEHAQWWEMLAQVAPDVVPHQAWVTQVRDLVVAELAAQDDDADDVAKKPQAR